MKCGRARLLPAVLAAAVLIALPVVAGAAGNNAAADANKPRINLNLKGVPVRSAIEMIFKGSGQSYVVEPGVSGDVTVVLVDRSFTDALSAVLKAANMTVRSEGGIYHIGPMKTVVDTPEGGNIPTDNGFEVDRAKVLEKIPIGYMDVYDLGTLFGVEVFTSRAYDLADSGGNGGSSNSSFGGSNSGSNSSNSSSSRSSSSSSSSSTSGTLR